MSYSAIVARLRNVRPHSNADRLQLATVCGDQVIVGLDAKEGDLGVYFPSDGQLSESFCKSNDLIRRKDENGNNAGGMFDINRRVRAQSFRGERSYGFWCPESYIFKWLKDSGCKDNIELNEGEELTCLNGNELCNKYVPKTNKSYSVEKQIKFSVKTFKEHFETPQLMRNLDKIQSDKPIIMTEKLHGTSQRVGRHKIEKNLNIFQKILKYLFNIDFSEWVDVIGTRRTVLKPGANVGYYSDEFRHRAAKPFIGNLHKGETIYYEVVGYESEGKTIMPGADSKKLKNHLNKDDYKEFVKKYGERIDFTYGCKPDEFGIYVYRITKTDEDGRSVDYSWGAVEQRCSELGVKTVPYIATFLNVDPDTFKPTIKKSNVVDTQVPEGVCLRIDDGLEPTIYKHKTFEFKVLEGIIKDSGIVDMEEADEES